MHSIINAFFYNNFLFWHYWSTSQSDAQNEPKAAMLIIFFYNWIILYLAAKQIKISLDSNNLNLDWRLLRQPSPNRNTLTRIKRFQIRYPAWIEQSKVKQWLRPLNLGAAGWFGKFHNVVFSEKQSSPIHIDNGELHLFPLQLFSHYHLFNLFVI